MAKRKAENTVKIERELATLDTVLTTLPSNPIPWLTVLSIVAPVISRLAVRYALKRLQRGMSEEKVNRIADQVATHIKEVIKKKEDGEGKTS